VLREAVIRRREEVTGNWRCEASLSVPLSECCQENAIGETRGGRM
jgi:hypothetical protein